MMNKKIKFKNKKNLVISVILILLVVGTLMFVILSNKNEEKTIIKGLALDSILAQESLFQPFDESKIKIKVYGEISKGLNLVGYDGKLRIETDCSDKIIDKNDKEIESDEKTYALSNEPVEVNNHCVISISNGTLNGFDFSSPYDYENHHYLQRLYLTAYFELPDSSLISLSSYGNPKIQINVYDNETRVVLENGSAYFRIAKQNPNHQFSVQVGNKIFSTTEGSEFWASTDSIYISGKTDQELSTLVDEFLVASKTNKNWNQEVSSYKLIYNGSFQLFKGSGYLSNRGQNSKEKITAEKYEFLYRFVEIFDPGKTEEKGNVINITEPSFKKYYDSVGYYDNVKGRWGTTEEVYENLDYQLSLNHLQLKMEKIITKEVKVKKTIINYLSYHSKQINNRISENKENEIAYIEKKKEEIKTCKDSDSYYVEEAKGCCKNGYVYNSSERNCVKYGCRTGYYDVGGSCCPVGSTITADGRHCSYPSKKTTAPTYYPKGSGNDTCVNLGTASAQLFCPGGNPRNSNVYIANRRCCIKNNIKEPEMELIP